ncbi:type I restriction endonuclease subunit S [Corynebacterium cystitidis]|uniref:type I restriction endonuclease subunit S n=1 Tax=Corynebacterium cystitidis TaxID=35757 RepID=UPI00211E33AD|nr:type I restriction endonuclease subunit S [Corynebacterium cystitidis]
MNGEVPFWSLITFVNDPDQTSDFGVRLEDIEPWSGKILATPPEDRKDLTGTPFQKDDVLFGKLRPYLAKSWLATSEGVAVGDIHVYRPLPHVEPRFLAYILRTPEFISFADGASEGVKMPRTEWSKLRQYPTYLPDLATQRRIASYLDAETGVIDETVKALDEYVELLEERLISFVDHELEKHRYSMCGVGFVSDVILGKMLASNRPSGDSQKLHYLRAAHVQPHGVLDFSVDEKQMWFSPTEASNLDLRRGDVVVVEGGAGFGRSACLKSELRGWGFQNSINRVRAYPDRAIGPYISIMLNRALKRGDTGLVASVATIPHFTAEKLARFRIPYIPLEDQVEFTDRVLREHDRIDRLVTECRELKDILLKRRQVLITDVVTGKVKV